MTAEEEEAVEKSWEAEAAEVAPKKAEELRASGQEILRVDRDARGGALDGGGAELGGGLAGGLAGGVAGGLEGGLYDVSIESENGRWERTWREGCETSMRTLWATWDDGPARRRCRRAV